MKNKKILSRTSMHEVGIVYKRPLFDDMPHISNSEDVYSLMKNIIDMDTLDYKEHFWVILLNNSNRVLGCSEIARGNTTGVFVNTKEILHLALMSNSTSIILCHNHPSGTLKPSCSDKKITKKIESITKLFDINVLDHIIITSEFYYSFADEGQL